jgi:site-specific recombinase XerD
MTEQLLNKSEIAYRSFVDTCRSPATRTSYVKALRYFMSYLRLPLDRYDKLLEPSTDIIQMNIADYIRYVKKNHSSATVSGYLAAIQKFYSMNDVTLNWLKLHSFEGEKEKENEDRPYTHSEIKTITEHMDLRDRAIVLLMSSSGSRIGAIPGVRMKDLEPIDSYNIYKITYYPKSKKSRYFSFCTPESRKAIDDYVDWRRRFGARLNEDSPLFVSRDSKPISVSGLRLHIMRMLRHAGLRPVVSIADQPWKRYPVMANHGFRKFFKTNAFRAGMSVEYTRRLLGQDGGQFALGDSYNKIEEQELLEGDNRHVGFVGIIDQLTIDDTHRLKREVQTLKIEKSKMERLEQKIAEFDRVLGLS